MKIYLDKLHKNAASNIQLSTAVPFKSGELPEVSRIAVYDGEKRLKTQSKVTSFYEDGSVRFAFVRFISDIPGNKDYEYELKLEEPVIEEGILINTIDQGYEVDTGAISFSVKNYAESIFDSLSYAGKTFTAKDFVGPLFTDNNGNSYQIELGEWRLKEAGPICTILSCEGVNRLGGEGCEEGINIRFVLELTAKYGESDIEIAYRIINTSEQPLAIKSLQMFVNMADGMADFSLTDMDDADKIDSTGCADMDVPLEDRGGVYHTVGPRDLEKANQAAPISGVRTVAGASNYRTDFLIGAEGRAVSKLATSAKILKEANEHFIEVFYGAFFADRTDADMGLCASIYQAQQNYPKAVKADKNGVYIYIVPETEDKVVMQPGMSREQRFLLAYHASTMSLEELDDRAVWYQLPPVPFAAPEVYKESGAVTDVFADNYNPVFEIALEDYADAHSRSFGMLNFGDTIDLHYTEQGRGGDMPVWINNEYDYPHAQALMYMRSGIRRFRDYCICHARHQMDVDICHYSSNPLYVGGQIEHTAGHVISGVLVPSHQWCEGLLDYYHLTGDERGLESAVGLGENVLRLLEEPAYQCTGEANARETGWALRLFTALYNETYDKKWIAKCEWIVKHFEEWYEECGGFGAQYTDHTLVRTPFMTAVAIGSLMRYYRLFPSESLKKLILAAVDDIYDNCRLKNGLFYYKELPSLQRNGQNPLLLEAMAVGYELTGDVKYLEAGKYTLLRAIKRSSNGGGSAKKKMGDAIMEGKGSTKNFAQAMYPMAVYYKMLCEAKLDGFIS